ncbi:MAG: riboflavin synthase [Gemmatimonadota bacterium]|nr:MAG: riboflavin synthase [Gemmatimonadota bacterium]
MFTGIIEELGIVQKIVRGGGGLTLTIHASQIIDDLAIGHSLSVNGVCLTVTSIEGQSFGLEAVEGTVRTTTLGKARVGDRVNLERAVRPSDRMGGHIVTGHVDGIGIIRSKEEKERSVIFTIEVPNEISRYIVLKGSVAVDGVSLTVTDSRDAHIVLSIIPHTAKGTTFGFRTVGHEVNIEVDPIGKYVEKFLGPSRGILDETRLKEMGY